MGIATCQLAAGNIRAASCMWVSRALGEGLTAAGQGTQAGHWSRASGQGTVTRHQGRVKRQHKGKTGPNFQEERGPLPQQQHVCYSQLVIVNILLIKLYYSTAV